MVNVAKEIRVLDLFSGIGGFSLGLKRAGGFKTVAYCEIEPYCQAVLLARMRDGWLDTAPICADIKKLDGKPWRGHVDLICGGFPCQDISVAGDMAGIEGERSGLWKEMGRLICEVRPRFAFVENVANLVGRGLGTVLGDLADIGYDATWTVIPASAVGAPHLRERIWIFAVSNQDGRDITAGSAKGEMYRGRSTQVHKPEGRDVSAPIQPSGSAARYSHRWEERAEGVFAGQIPWVEEFSWCKDVRRVEDLRGRSDIPEPLFRGSRDGVPHWVDRVGSIGNAVVPAIVEWCGRRIAEFANRQN